MSSSKNRTDWEMQNQILMYGQAPGWIGDPPTTHPDVNPYPNPDSGRATTKPTILLPDLGTEMTTLTRLYNVEQEFNRLKIVVEELKKTVDDFIAKQDNVNGRALDMFVALYNGMDGVEEEVVVVKKKPAKKSEKKTKKAKKSKR